MASHVFHEIYLHINWHTKDDRPLLQRDIEREVHDHIRDRSRATKGVYFHGIGGTETHVHLAMNIEPHVTISTLIGELKGSCAHDINKAKTRKLIDWQRGYGVVSFGKNDLEWVLGYIAGQKEHHGEKRTHERLEKITAFEDDYRSGEDA